MNRPGSLFPQFAEKRAALRNAGILTGIGLLGLIPALVLVGTGITGRKPWAPLVHPVLLLGGLAVAFGASFVAVTHWETHRIPGHFQISCTIRKRWLDLVILAASIVLLLIILVYSFKENYQAR